MKNYRIIAAAALMLMCSAAVAQENIRQWAEGPLTWDDITSVASPDGTACRFAYSLGYVEDTATAPDGVRSIYWRAVGGMDQRESWVDAGSRSDARLRYLQVCLDLVEAERRHLATVLLEGCDPETALTMSKASLSDKLLTLGTGTAQGTDTAALAAWRHSSGERLVEYATEPRPDYGPRRFIGAVYLGADGHVNFGDVADYFKGGMGIDLGFELGYGRHLFVSSFTISSSSASWPLYFESRDGSTHTVNAGASAPFANSMVFYGYRVVDNPVRTLTPMVGWSTGSHTLTAGDGELAQVESHGPVVGISLRHHFWSRHRLPTKNLFSSAYSAELSHWSIETRLYAMYQDYPKSGANLRGWSMNISIGIAYGGGYQRPKVRVD